MSETHPGRKRVALVIGNSRYQHGSQLHNPGNDARDIAAALTRIGFSGINWRDGDFVCETNVAGVAAIDDLDYNRMRRALAAFSRFSKGAAQSILYYAGHGVEVAGENYLVPVDAKLDHETDVEFETSTLTQVMRAFEPKTELGLVILDACRDNPFSRRWVGTRSMARGLSPVKPEGDTLVVYAAKDGTVALDGVGAAANSPFAAALLKHIESPGLDVVDLYRKVKSEVKRATSERQEPHLYGSPGDQRIYLVPPSAPDAQPLAPATLGLIDTVTIEHTQWLSVSQERDPSRIESFLSHFPDGKYAVLAADRVADRIAECRDAVMLQRFLEKWPQSPRREFCQKRLADLNNSEVGGWSKRAKSIVALALTLAVAGFATDAVFELTPINTGRFFRSAFSPEHRDWYALEESADIEVIRRFAATVKNPSLKLAAEARMAELVSAPQTRTLATPLTLPEERALKPEDSFRECAECPEMVVVPAGTYVRGSPDDEEGRGKNEGPQRRVTIPRAFAVGKFEVTFSEWDECVLGGGCNGYRPDDNKWGRGRQPANNVSSNDVQAYVDWLSRKTGKTYRLLTEAEWEYAARAGAPTPFSFGPTISPDEANYNGDFTYGAGRNGVYRQKAIPVGSFSANAFGLFDMHGNVWEWVADCYRDSYANAPVDGGAFISSNCSNRVLRGGSWFNDPQYLRSAVRYDIQPVNRDNGIGFRLARTLSP